jgi:hypothetical protein
MKALQGFFARLRDAAQATDPVASYGAIYEGTYEPQNNAIVGSVARANNRYPPARVILVKEGAIIASTEQFDTYHNSWRFALDAAIVLSGDDILKDRISVFALDRRGARSQLKIDGAAQLGYIRDKFSPTQTELEIDFSKDGNSKQYLREGWSGQEPEHIWTEGKRSSIAIAFAAPGKAYSIELLAWPFTVPNQIRSQDLVVSLLDIVLGRFTLGPRQHLVECGVPSDLTVHGVQTLWFDLPNAARPCDVGVNRETRMLGLACKRLKIRRVLGVSDMPQKSAT